MKQNRKQIIVIVIIMIFLCSSLTAAAPTEKTENTTLQNTEEKIVKTSIIDQNQQDEQSTSQQKEITFTQEFQAPHEQQKTGDDDTTFLSYSIDDSEYTATVGGPQLPCKNIWVQIPSDATNIKINVLTDEYTEDIVDQKIYPTPELVYTKDLNGDKAMIEQFSYDSAAYEKNAWWPSSEPAVLDSVFTIRGVHVVAINLYPILYNPTIDTIHRYTTIKATVIYDSVQTQNICTLYQNDPMKTLLSARIINFNCDDSQQEPGHSSLDDGELHMVSQQDFQNIQTPSFYPDYLIIAPHTFFPSFDQLSPALTDLIDQRRLVDDYNVAIVRLEDIVQYGHGDTTPQRIRNFILDVYTYWRHNANIPELDYLLLVGDADNITDCEQQPWYIPPYEIIHNPEDYAGSPSDYYYCLMDEWEGPSLAMGRLPMKTEPELSNYVAKVLTFENNPPQDPNSWGNRMILMSGNWRWSGSFDDGINGEYEYFRQTVDSLLQSTAYHTQVDEFYADIWGHSHDEQLNAINTFMNMVNDGAFYIGEGGHGNRIGWGFLHTGDNLANLLQNQHPTIITSGSCETGHFGWNESDCFDEVWVKSAYGAVAVIGSSISWAPPCFDRDVITCLYSDHIYRMGTILNYIRRSMSYYSMHLLGDPALNVESYAALSSASPDFMITNANVTYNTQTNTYDADVTVKNIRHANNINTQIGMYYSDIDDGDELFYTTPITITQQELTTFSFSFPNPMLPDYWGTLSIYIKIDPNNQISELSETNNIYPTTRSIYVRNFPFQSQPLSKDGFPVLIKDRDSFGMYGLVKSSPIVADINGDGYDEIIVQTQQNSGYGKCYAYSASGTLLPGWPKEYEGLEYSSPVIGDINNDGLLEIIIMEALSSSHTIHVVDSAGNELPDFHRDATPGRISSSPVLADVNNDGFLEIIYGTTTTGTLYVIDRFGNDVPGWPITIGSVAPVPGTYQIVASPAVGDIDDDGANEIVIGCTTTDGRGGLYAFHGNGALFWDEPFIGEEDCQALAFANAPALADVDLDGDLEIAFSTELQDDVENLRSHHLCLIHHDKTFVTNWPVSIDWHPLEGCTPRDEHVRPPITFADLDGNSIPEIIYMIDSGNRHEIFIYNTTTGAPFNSNWGYTNDNGWCSPTAKTTIRDSVKGTLLTQGIVVQDINNDGSPEILFGGGCNQLFAFDTNGHLVSGFPISIERFVYFDPKFSYVSSPVIRDIDHDGCAEIVFLSTTRSGFTATFRTGTYLHVLKTPYLFNPSGVEWGMEGGNGGRTRTYQRTLQPTDDILSIIPQTPTESFIRLKHGTYFVNHALTIQPGVHLIGENPTTTIIQSLSGLEHPYPALITKGASLLANFGISNSLLGIQIEAHSTPIIRNIRFSNYLYCAVQVNGGGHIEHCVFSGSGHGINTYFGSLRLQITHNSFQDNTNGVVATWSPAKSLLIFGNFFYNNGHALTVTHSNQNTIRGNTFTQNTYGTTFDAESIYNNVTSNSYFGNTYQAVDEGTNLYDTGSTGNYWSDYTGNDADGDGIGETPYQILNGGNTDHRPFILSLVDSLVVYADIPTFSDTLTVVQFHGYVKGVSFPYTWHWDFGDGNTSSEQNPGHIYAEDNIYTVSLSVVDDEGLHDTFTSHIRIHGPLRVHSVELYYYQLINTPIQFTAHATGGAPPYTWLWDFGDGQTSTQQNPQHTFTTIRYHTVTVTVQDSGVNISTIQINVTIADPTTNVYIDDDFFEETPGWQLDRFSIIQDGINTISPHGTVYVFEGTYYEHLSITQPMSLIGEQMNTTILEGQNGFNVGISITANYVNISRFTVDYFGIGIRLTNVAYCTIFNNNITNNLEYGIRTVSAHDNKFYLNNLIGNIQNAYAPLYNIWDEASYGNYWDDYTGIDVNHDGIGDTSYDVPGVVHGLNQDYYPLMNPYPYTTTITVDDDYTQATPGWGYNKFNTIQLALDCVLPEGIVYVHSGQYRERLNIIKTVSLIGNGSDTTIVHGSSNQNYIVCIPANDSLIKGFTFENSTLAGLILQSCHDTTLIQNTIKNTSRGIFFARPASGTVPFDNIIYHNNFISNSVDNIFGTSIDTRFDDGYPSGGNYWDDHTNPQDEFNGPNQNQPGADGIIDLGLPSGGINPYQVSGNQQDQYPFYHPYGPVTNLDTNRVYTTITNALNDPHTVSGHTLVIRSGVYPESIHITKQVTLIGENKDTTILTGDGLNTIVTFSTGGITLQGCSIQNTGGSLDNIGIRVESNQNSISGNNIICNGVGISLYKSTGNTIEANDITSALTGIYGIDLDKSSCNIISRNSVNKFLSGIYVHEKSNKNIIRENDIAQNMYGIYIEHSEENSILLNSYSRNSAENAYQVFCINQWKCNYWDDYTTSYPAVDDNHDGIWDVPYAIPFEGESHDYDYAPLITPYDTEIHVLSPNGGEVWSSFSPHIIQWESNGYDGQQAQIFLSYKPDSEWIPITEQVVNHHGLNTYEWVMMPPYPHQSTHCKIKIEIISSPNGPFDTSDNEFSITEVPQSDLILLSPNGGETWRRGTLHDIIWESYEKATQKVYLLYSTDAGNTWTFLDSSPNNAGANKYSWTIPKDFLLSSYCKIKIQSAENDELYDISDKTFSVVK